MESIIIATFTDLSKAINGLEKLAQLEREGDINVFNKVLIRKSSNGEVEILKGDNSEGWRTLAGLAIGGLIGAFGGPVGFAIGIYAGTALGAVGEFNHYIFDQDFVNIVSSEIRNTTTSIIAEVDEDSLVFIENNLEPLGATITTSNIHLNHGTFVTEKLDELDAKTDTAVKG